MDRIDEDDILNKEFATSTYYGQPSIEEKDLIKELESDSWIHRLLIKRGYITSKQFPFITYASFSDKINSILDGRYNGDKSEERKQQARNMICIVQDYVNSLNNNNSEMSSFRKPIRLNFAGRNDNECALYDMNRYTGNQINKILIEEFR